MKYKIDGKFIEIYFDKMPSEAIRETLKICGWHWFGKKKCWSNLNNKENLIWAEALSKELNPEPENPLLKLKKCSIGMEDLIVRSNGFYCNKHHDLEDMAGEIDLVSKSGEIFTCLIPIVYCKSCDVYYLLEDIYKDIKTKGHIRCKVLSFQEYKKENKPEPGTLNDISPLREWGYTVSQARGYSDAQRQGILEDIIDYGIMTKDEVLSYLSFFMHLNHNGSDVALSKWKADRDYIADYKLGSSKRIRVEKIIVYEKKPY